MNTIQETVKRGYPIRREVHFYAQSPNGIVEYPLVGDWTTELVDRALLAALDNPKALFRAARHSKTTDCSIDEWKSTTP